MLGQSVYFHKFKRQDKKHSCQWDPRTPCDCTEAMKSVKPSEFSLGDILSK